MVADYIPAAFAVLAIGWALRLESRITSVEGADQGAADRHRELKTDVMSINAKVEKIDEKLDVVINEMSKQIGRESERDGREDSRDIREVARDDRESAKDSRRRPFSGKAGT